MQDDIDNSLLPSQSLNGSSDGVRRSLDSKFPIPDKMKFGKGKLGDSGNGKLGDSGNGKLGDSGNGKLGDSGNGKLGDSLTNELSAFENAIDKQQQNFDAERKLARANERIEQLQKALTDLQSVNQVC